MFFENAIKRKQNTNGVRKRIQNLDINLSVTLRKLIVNGLWFMVSGGGKQ